MRVITNKFIAWLMEQTRLVRYFVISVLFHVALAAVLGSIKIVAVLPKIVAAFESASVPTALTEPDDPYAAYRDFEYKGVRLSADKSPNVPEGYQAHIQAPSAQSGPPTVAEVIGVQSVEATEIARPTAGMGAVGPSFSAGEIKVATPTIKGPGAQLLAARLPSAQRTAAIKKYGITQQVEASIVNGLRWLQKQQKPDGAWNLPRSQIAGTALAVLCYLGHGDTPDTAEFGATVTKGLEYLIKSVAPDGSVSGGMYIQGLVMLALAEAYTMTASPALLNPLERAVKATIAAQNVPKKNPRHNGGWRYTLTSDDADVSATGWVVMGLKSAKNAGVDVPDVVFERAAQFLWNMYDATGFGYDAPGKGPGTSAVGVLCMQFMGHGNDKRIRPVLDAIRERRVDWGKPGGGWPLYTWYYATQAMFQAGDPYWPSWNSNFRDQFIQAQAKDGHWEAPEGTEAAQESLGPIYATTMAILSLEVYYRYLPLYQILEQQKTAPAPGAGAAK